MSKFRSSWCQCQCTASWPGASPSRSLWSYGSTLRSPWRTSTCLESGLRCCCRLLILLHPLFVPIVLPAVVQPFIWFIKQFKWRNCSIVIYVYCLGLTAPTRRDFAEITGFHLLVIVKIGSTEALKMNIWIRQQLLTWNDFQKLSACKQHRFVRARKKNKLAFFLVAPWWWSLRNNEL